MAATTMEDRPLVSLRDDLEISRGAPFLNGAPGWVIYDPTRHRFFQVGQFTVDVLSRWSAGTVSLLKSRLFAEKAMQVADAEVEAIEQFLHDNQLLEASEKGTARRFAGAVQGSLVQRIWRGAQKLLFVRVPLVRPEVFLQATWPAVRPLCTRHFVWITAIVLLFSVFLAGRQYADIEAHARQSFSWAGVGLFLGAIAFIKMLHELGHAYQAISRGLRVPVMGVAFFAFLPLLYTDVSDAWRLRRRRDRLMVDLGGIFVELTVAVYATLWWCFLPDGPARTIAFAIATSSWVLSLLVNLNPFMRFDGYYLLADSFGIHNMQQRSFALAKWALRHWLFGIEDAVPERLHASSRRALICYAYGVWLYRFFLFLTIALLVYTMFFKLAGIVLLIVSVSAFLLKPIVTEVLFWISARDRMRGSKRSIVTLFTVGLMVTVFFVPLPTRFQSPAVIEDAGQQLVFPPDASRLETILVSEGQSVSRGDPLFVFADPALPVRIAQSQTRIELLNARTLSGAGDAVARAEGQVIARILDEETQTLSALQEKRDSLTVFATTEGLVRDLLPDLTLGAWYPRDMLLGRIIKPGGLKVSGYISEEDRESLDPKAPARFIPDDVTLPALDLEDLMLSDFAVDRLQDGYLATTNGGAIAVANADPDSLVVAGVWYPLTARPEEGTASGWSHDNRVVRGVVSLRRTPQSMAHRTWKRIVRVMIREFEF